LPAPAPGSTPAANRTCSASSYSTARPCWDGTKWREICLGHTVGLIATLLQDGIERSSIPPQPIEALTHVLVGAVDEAALYIAQADDRSAARADMDLVLRRLTQGLAAAD
jgi:hypothetical protein